MPDYRFRFILWPFILLGAINLMLTTGNGFPFGLLVPLGPVAVRAPCPHGLLKASASTGDPVASVNYDPVLDHARQRRLPPKRRTWR
ncbi:hypothetical protein [Rhodopila sp.]|uniref:hypothetical protein n=1 Tax=Rhodopila sp. TaxID=2480087 RepID=UPI003D0A3E78